MALEPITRQEQIIAGKKLEPITRLERFLRDYGGGGGGSAQADWNASEGEPGHILNRPFYEGIGMVDIVPETEIQLEDAQGVLFYEVPITVGNNYTVNWNGVEYNCTAVPFEMEGMSFVGLGDVGALAGEPTGSEPFVFGAVPPELMGATGGVGAMFMALDGSSTVTLSIKGEGEVIHKLDNKYLDLDWIPSVTRTPKTVFDEDIKFGTSGMKMYEDNPPFELKKGQTYVVNWGGTEYICEVKTFTEYNEAIGSDNTYIWIGNHHINNEEMEDTGEPFCYSGYAATAMEVYGYIYGWYKGSGEATISVRVDTEDIEVNKMPEMFLPDSVSGGGGEVCGVLFTIVGSATAICNKTHAELLAAWGKKPVIASIFVNMGTESGYQYIDTAAMYDSEANVFAFIKNDSTFVLLPDNTCIIEQNEG